MAEKAFRFVVPGQDGAGDQVFEADTLDEYNEKIANAHGHATAKIRELAQENAQLRAERVAPTADQTNSSDKKQELFQTLYNSPVEFIKKGFSEAVGMPFDQAINQFRQVISASEASRIEAMCGRLLSEMPQIGGTSETEQQKNFDVIGKYIAENGMPVNDATLRATAMVLERDGKLKVAARDVGSEVVMPNVPTTVTRPAAPVNTDQSEKEFFRTAKTEDIRVYLEKKHADARA